MKSVSSVFEVRGKSFEIGVCDLQFLVDKKHFTIQKATIEAKKRLQTSLAVMGIDVKLNEIFSVKS